MNRFLCVQTSWRLAEVTDCSGQGRLRSRLAYRTCRLASVVLLIWATVGLGRCFRFVSVNRSSFSTQPQAAKEITIAPAELTSDVSRALIAALNTELEASYPEPGATHFGLAPEEVSGARGAFLIVKGTQVTPRFTASTWWSRPVVAEHAPFGMR